MHGFSAFLFFVLILGDKSVHHISISHMSYTKEFLIEASREDTIRCSTKREKLIVCLAVEQFFVRSRH